MRPRSAQDRAVLLRHSRPGRLSLMDAPHLEGEIIGSNVHSRSTFALLEHDRFEPLPTGMVRELAALDWRFLPLLTDSVRRTWTCGPPREGFRLRCRVPFLPRASSRDPDGVNRISLYRISVSQRCRSLAARRSLYCPVLHRNPSSATLRGNRRRPFRRLSLASSPGRPDSAHRSARRRSRTAAANLDFTRSKGLEKPG